MLVWCWWLCCCCGSFAFSSRFKTSRRRLPGHVRSADRQVERTKKIDVTNHLGLVFARIFPAFSPKNAIIALARQLFSSLRDSANRVTTSKPGNNKYPNKSPYTVVLTDVAKDWWPFSGKKKTRKMVGTARRLVSARPLQFFDRSTQYDALKPWTHLLLGVLFIFDGKRE